MLQKPRSEHTCSRPSGLRPLTKSHQPSQGPPGPHRPCGHPRSSPNAHPQAPRPACCSSGTRAPSCLRYLLIQQLSPQPGTLLPPSPALLSCPLGCTMFTHQQRGLLLLYYVLSGLKCKRSLFCSLLCPQGPEQCPARVGSKHVWMQVRRLSGQARRCRWEEAVLAPAVQQVPRGFLSLAQTPAPACREGLPSG